LVLALWNAEGLERRSKRIGQKTAGAANHFT
jgi:hypothetical protein